MGDDSKIQWTDATWNPIRGCSRVSEGCRNCYAESIANRFSGEGLPYEGLTTDKGRWNGKIMWVPTKLDEPLRWTRPRLIFANSMSDMFHEALSFDRIAALFGIMAAAPRHRFQVLTKRPGRAREFFGWLEDRSGSCREAILSRAAEELDQVPHENYRDHGDELGDALGGSWPLPNVWIGVSAEDQTTAEARVPELLRVPAAVRFVSAEPLLGPVDLLQWMLPCPLPYGQPNGDIVWRNRHVGMSTRCTYCAGVNLLDWVIVGGESGPGARTCDAGWIRDLVHQCGEAEVPVFVKQLGSQPVWESPLDSSPGELRFEDSKGGDPDEWPRSFRVRQVPDG